MDPRVKECFVLLEKIDVTPYKKNTDNKVSEKNLDVPDEQNGMNELNSLAIGKNDSFEEIESDSDEEEAAANFVLLASLHLLIQNAKDENKVSRKIKNRRRSVWVREWTKKDELRRELRGGDLGERRLYREFIRMLHDEFEYLLELIEKRNTRFREAIPAGERLALTLHFLATGQSFASLQYLFRIPQSTISMYSVVIQ